MRMGVCEGLLTPNRTDMDTLLVGVDIEGGRGLSEATDRPPGLSPALGTMHT